MAGKSSGGKKGPGKGGRDPSVNNSRRVKDARASGGKAAKSARGVGPACEKCGQIHKRCSAHNNRGGPCGQQPLRFQQVCRSHGGATKLSKRAAQERMMELVWPAMARLDQLVNDPDTDPAIVVKVVAQILDRAHSAGLTRHHQVGVSLEPTPFDNLTDTAFVVLRGRENVIDGDEHEALGGGEGEDEVLEAILDKRKRAKQRDASTRIEHGDHDVVEGRVVSPDEANLFGFERTRAERLRDSGYKTEHDPDGHRPDAEPWADYEKRLREGLE